MVRVHKSKDDDTPFGKRAFKSAKDDWKVGDTISLKSCVNPDLTPCKDVTYGECDIEKSEVLSKTSKQSVQLCNAECYDTYNCTNYRYNNQTKECTLMTNKTDDYRWNCNIQAGPGDKFMYECMKYTSDQVCDAHLEEDCEYNGELLRREIGFGSAITCEDECKLHSPDCKY